MLAEARKSDSLEKPMHQFEVHFYVEGIASQLVSVITASSRQDAEAAVKAMYSGRSVQIHSVVRI